ncbi:PTS lactose/cellobiose transporter subunit IIA [Spiroplasma diminutum]|uniref:PTS system cellobiose-specific IIA component n=1 Tax=Spiroplasma diminutum CUAS-1 TaxID=1276221 RepID=S5LZ93_9MOLU|nr:PTS lactose/cellobiose transporter subunit IIA [Spiroplasma diminutum]AGR41896.1 PTS system cellobiose-specific IIA component [Spiroplasma diminutum CUAS-1]
MNEINWENISMEMISCIGTSKSNAIMAIRAAKNQDFVKAKDLILEAEIEMSKAHNLHFDIVSREANGEKLDLKLLFLHAEDQMLTTQAMIDLGKEMIEMYKIIYK